jgi:hypothetical protein
MFSEKRVSKYGRLTVYFHPQEYLKWFWMVSAPTSGRKLFPRESLNIKRPTYFLPLTDQKNSIWFLINQR